MKLSAAYFNPLGENDITNLKNYLDKIIMACSVGDGISGLSCASDPDMEIEGPGTNATVRFFCLPEIITCTDGTTEKIPLPELDPLTENYVAHVNQMCSCGGPETCRCTGGRHSEISAPFDFPKLLGCIPEQCMCQGHSAPVDAPQPYHLRPLANAVSDFSEESVILV